jgi:transposase
MNTEWLDDGRKIPDDVMYYLRAMAVYAVRVLGYSPEIVYKIYNVNRSCIYRWLSQYDEGGFEALESIMPPGAKPVITDKIDDWLKETILNKTPEDFGYDTNLWTARIVVNLLKQEFRISVAESTVRLHFKRLNLSCQTPEYQDKQRDEQEIEKFLNIKFPMIQRLAEKMGAEIGFEDEAGIGIMTRHGRTWGEKGKTPIVKACMQRGGYNVLSMVTPQGKIEYSIEDGHIKGEQYINFLRQLIADRKKPLILLVDHATFHRSKDVRNFVKYNRTKLRIFFLPKRAPEYNPDEQVWNEIKNNHIGKKPIKSKLNLEYRIISAFLMLKENVDRVISFFSLKNTKYASEMSFN